MEETKWQLSKEDYERIKAESIEKVIDEHFTDATQERKLGLALFFEDFLNHIMPVERRIFLKGNKVMTIAEMVHIIEFYHLF